MATSDNVLRGGLTPKHVDVPELLRTVDTSPLDDPIVRPRDGHYDTPAPEFHLRRLDIDGSFEVEAGDGPQILWCRDGGFEGLTRGEAAYLRHGSGAVLVGTGSVFRPLFWSKPAISGGFDKQGCRWDLAYIVRSQR